MGAHQALVEVDRNPGFFQMHYHEGDIFGAHVVDRERLCEILIGEPSLLPPESDQTFKGASVDCRLHHAPSAGRI
jgi:hypothetical protein